MIYERVRMQVFRRLGGLAVAGVALVLCSCGGGGDGGGEEGLVSEPQKPLVETPSFISPDNLETTFDVTWQDDVTRVQPDALDALIRYDWATQEYVFDAAAADAAGLALEKDRVLMIHGLTLRTITKVSHEGDEIVVQTGSASLEDAIQDGELGWDYQMEFTPEVFEHAIMRFREVQMSDTGVRTGELVSARQAGLDESSVELTISGNEAHYTFTSGPYSYDLAFQLNGDTFATAFNVTKEYGGDTRVRYYVEGDVSAPTNRASASYTGGELQNFDYDTGGLSGQLRVGIAAAGSGPDEIKVALPAPAFRFPILVGGIPVVIEIGAELAFNSDVPLEAMASVQVENTFNFDTDMGIRYDGSDVTTESRLGPIDLLEGNVDAASEFTPLHAGMQLGFPRVSVSVLGSSLSGYLQPELAVIGQLSFGPVCQKAEIRLGGTIGYDVSIFGVVPVASDEKELYREVDEAVQEGCEG